MHGHWVEFDWHGCDARAWLPDTLAERTFEFDNATVRAGEQATAAISQSDSSRPANWEPLARLLLRTEGIASSSIEGVRAPLVDIALAEITSGIGAAGWIADNLATVTSAMAHTELLTIDVLHQWHHQLMGHSSLDAPMIGAFRTAPSWIGGTSPLDAAFVPPPAEMVGDLMTALVEYANHDHFDAVTHAALIHAQFETIHPYSDGNGRLGRILIGWLLRRRGVIDRLPPPVSVLIGRDPGGYISGLHLFREGPVDSYVRWFAKTAHSAATQSAKMIETITSIITEWETQLASLRSDAAARRLLPLLPQAPVLTASIVADLLGTSERSARSALEVLSDNKIVGRIEAPATASKVGRTPDYFAATQLLDATSTWVR